MAPGGLTFDVCLPDFLHLAVQFFKRAVVVDYDVGAPLFFSKAQLIGLASGDFALSPAARVRGALFAGCFICLNVNQQ